MAVKLAKNTDRFQIDMTKGPLLWQIVVFAFPLIISGLLQLFFHAADFMVVGRFASHRALAAVGAPAPAINLLVNIFLGLSVGTNVLVARYLGEDSRKKTSRAVHTAILFSCVGGTILAIAGLILSRPLLTYMGTPEDIMSMALVYTRIYFAGMPLVMLYNFGSAVMRAMGDTRRPFIFLLISGIINVVLNLFFVLCCGMDVGGVALATVISQGLSAALILKVLMGKRDSCRFNIRAIHMEWKILSTMMMIGIPAGLQQACFSFSNVIIQSSVNTFGSAAIAGLTGAVTWECIGFFISGAIGQTVVSFVGQNSGAKQFRRIRESIFDCAALSGGLILIVGVFLFIFAEELLAVFNTDEEVIRWGVRRFKITLPLLFSCGLQESLGGALRGMGKSFPQMIITVFNVCVFRIIWVKTVFEHFESMESLLLSFPVSWGLNTLAMWAALYLILRKMPKKNAVLSK